MIPGNTAIAITNAVAGFMTQGSGAQGIKVRAKSVNTQRGQPRGVGKLITGNVGWSLVEIDITAIQSAGAQRGVTRKIVLPAIRPVVSHIHPSHARTIE